MRDKPISDLRRRMIADMTVRSFSGKVFPHKVGDQVRKTAINFKKI